MSRIRVYIATSLDGFIAGEDDDLSWLPHNEVDEPGDAVGFTDFMGEIGAMLMGRRTYDVVAGFDGPWPYGDTPVLVATHRPLENAGATVRAISGSIDQVLDAALQAAGGRDVYVDGGRLVQQALAAGRIDELILTVVPIVLGGGIRLFGPLEQPVDLEFGPPHRFGSMVQLRAGRRLTTS